MRITSRLRTIAIGTVEGRVDRRVMRFPYQEFDLPTLQKIAQLTGAEQYWAKDLEALKKTFTTIDHLEKTEAQSFAVIEDTELFPWFLGCTLLAALAAATLLALNPPPTP